jgi:hypothetical protein
MSRRYEGFKGAYSSAFEKRYGFFRPIVDEVVEAYLKCGDLREGFARVRCTNPDCCHEYLLAFSCKGRWFCPSCHSKKVVKFGDNISHNILYPVPHRQYVFSIPICLRVYFKYDRELLTEFCHCAKESLEVFFRNVLGLENGVTGLVMVIHTFGDYARFHPHAHAIVADGLFRANGTFYVLPTGDHQPLEEIFRAKILAMLKREGKIDDVLIRKLMGWRHSGFSVYRGNRIARDDQEGQEALAQYIIRNAFSEDKITFIDDTGKVLYRSGMTHGKNKKNFELFTAEEFIAAITQHIPEKSFQMVRYFGWYSNRSRGTRKKAGLLKPGDEPLKEALIGEGLIELDVSDYDPPPVPSKTWRELIKKVWEVDPLVCPWCGHALKIISLIQDPDVIRQILEHVGLWDRGVREPLGGGCGKMPVKGPVGYGGFDDGWPGYEEPVL